MMRTSDDIFAESAFRLSDSHRQARGLRRALSGAAIVIVLQWAIIIWLIWFRRPN
jgi:hypothetical protein